MSGRSSVAGLALVLALLAAPACAGDNAAGMQPITAAEMPTRTGKERLGHKWSDEQRLDNCNVPPDKRGPKRRPDGCVPPPSI